MVSRLDSPRLSAEIWFLRFFSFSAKVKMRKERRAKMGGWLETAVFYLFISVDGEKRGNAVSCPLFITHTIHGSSLYRLPMAFSKYEKIQAFLIA